MTDTTKRFNLERDREGPSVRLATFTDDGETAAMLSASSPGLSISLHFTATEVRQLAAMFAASAAALEGVTP